MAGEFFDPSPDTPFTPSVNLPEGDPLRDWAAQLSDPQLQQLMASDPRAAVERMKELGIPPPPPEISRYAEGGIDNLRNPPLPTQVVGGAPPPVVYPPTQDPMQGTAPAPQGMARAREIGGGIMDSLRDTGSMIAGVLPTFSADGKMLGNLTSEQGVPPGSKYVGGGIGSDPSARELPPAAAPASANYFDPEPEVNPNPVAPGSVPLPRENPNRPTDTSAQRKPSLSEGLGGFADSLKGVKAPAPPPLNPVSTPSAPRPNQINAPALNNLLAMVGQAAPSPLTLTLGRLLATGKA